MQNEFQFFITKIIHGVGSSKKVGDIAKKLGARKALVMHGPNVKAAGIIDPCIEALKADGITCIIYDKVEIESPMHSIEEAAALGRAEGADICVAIGGGSCMDTAKVARMLITNPGLEAAVTLTKRGFDVTVFEKSDRIGGAVNLADAPIGKYKLGWRHRVATSA